MAKENGASSPALALMRFAPEILHRLFVPTLIFVLFFDLAILNPVEITWLMKGDLSQHFAGWAAFRFDSWRWPIGFTQLLAYPHGAPISATDSNPLFSLLFKPLSPLLPEQFQFVGFWYFFSLFLSYNIVFSLLKHLSNRPWPAVPAAALIAAAPIFFLRYGHDTLMAHWLILASLSTFIRIRSDRSALARHSGVNCLSIAVHPYFLPMTVPIAGVDVLRRAYWRHRAAPDSRLTLCFLAGGLGVIGVPALLVGFALGLFSMETSPQTIGFYTMDPFAWFNSLGLSLFLNEWEVGLGQRHEGFQYLGLGGLMSVTVAAGLWLTGLARPPAALRRSLPWLAPALVFFFLFAISPVVTVLGETILTLDVSGWPIVGYLCSSLRSSGRLAWPVSYLILIVAAGVWLTIRSRWLTAILVGLVVLQIADLAPLARRTKLATAPRDTAFRELESIHSWRRLIDDADRVYVAPGIKKEVLFELGLLAFPKQKSLSRFYLSQNLWFGPQEEVRRSAVERVRAGHLSEDTLYVLDRADIRSWFELGAPSLEQVLILDGLMLKAPARSIPDADDRSLFASTLADESLYELVESCHSNCAIVLSVRDEATRKLSGDFVDLVKGRGGNMGALSFRGSYAAILINGRIVKEAMSGSADVNLRASPFDFAVKVSSGGYHASNSSSIRVNDIELSPNTRGINVVRVEPSGVSAIRVFDTYQYPEASEPTS